MKKIIFPESSSCLAKKYLSDKLYTSLKSLRTSRGFSLSDAVRSGMVNSDSNIGFYAGDEESYSLFAALLDPIIEDYHGINLEAPNTPSTLPLNLGGFEDSSNIVSLRIRVARNISPFSFTPNMKVEEREKLEHLFTEKIGTLPHEFKGQYYSFSDIDTPTKKMLGEQKLIFPIGDRFQDAAGINRDYPKGRGIFVSKDHRLRIWLNEEDHLRIICQERSPDLAGLYAYFRRAMSSLESLFQFCWQEKYGYLTSCPTNIGTSMRAGAHVRLNKLNEKRDYLQQIANIYNLQIRGTSGEKTDVENCIFDLSNRQRFGLTEEEIITKLYSGLTEVLQAENN